MIRRARPGLFRAALAATFGLVLIWAQAAAAQQLGEGGGVEISYWRVFAALLFCLLIAVAAAFALRHRLRGGRSLSTIRLLRNKWFEKTNRRIELLESLRLSHQADICIVAVDGEEMLLAITAAGVFRLDFRDEPEASGPPR